MADSTSFIDTISSSQAQKEVTANNAFNAGSPALFGARRSTTSTSLTWGYYGGRWKGTSVANGTLALTASTTNYIVANRDTGAITVATTTTNWNDDANYDRLYSVVAGTTSVTSYQDHRQAYGVTRRIQIKTYTPVSPPAYTLDAGDLGKTLEFSSTTTVILTLPDTFPKGFFCEVVQAGAGSVNFVPFSAGTLNHRLSHDETAGQWAVTRIYVSDNPTGSAPTWVLSGDTA
jgi:hypothetical protein